MKYACDPPLVILGFDTKHLSNHQLFPQGNTVAKGDKDLVLLDTT